MKYIAPLRCARCGWPIVRTPKAKTPKYCENCRKIIQDEYKEKTRR